MEDNYMINFTFNNPTKMIFGKGTENNVHEEILLCGAKKVLIHYGGNSAKKTGLLDRVIKSLTDNKIEHILLGGARPNPVLSLVHEGISLCKKENVDFILAVGGGSAIDSAKAIALGAVDDGEVWDFYMQTRQPKNALPVGVILTIAAAGSESSVSSVITNEEGLLKRGYSGTLLYPKFSILNPELTFTLPTYQISCGIVDMFMHTLERYFCTTYNTDLIDRLSEGLLISVVRNAKIVMNDQNNYDSMANIMWAGATSHNGILGNGKDSDWATHNLEHELSALYDVAHGAGLAAIWPSWARYVFRENVARFAVYAVNVWGVKMDLKNPHITALDGIDRTEQFFASINMPINIKQLGIDNPDIETMAKKCSSDGKSTIGSFMELNKKDMECIYEMARG
jgi:alcohol dehydrogenase